MVALACFLEGRLTRLTVLLRHYVCGARIEDTSEQDDMVLTRFAEVLWLSRCSWYIPAPPLAVRSSQTATWPFASEGLLTKELLLSKAYGAPPLSFRSITNGAGERVWNSHALD